MATRKPLVIINGQPQELPAGDTLNAVASEVDVVIAVNANAGSVPRGTAMYVSSAGSVDKARANASGTRKALGLVHAASINAAASGSIQTNGVLTATTGEWDAVTGQTGGLTAGATYYLSASTAGRITTTAPTGSGEYVHEIGLALSATELDLDIDRSGILLA